MVFDILKTKKSLPDHHEEAGILAEAWMALWKADDLRSLNINSIDLKIHAGEVVLVGHVFDLQHCHLAENLVKAVPSVAGVHNELVVDSDLAIKVAQALSEHPRTRPYILPVGAFHGWVHLGGEVPTSEARSAAEEVAASLPEVRGVVTLPNLPGENGVSCQGAGKARCQIQPQIGDQVYASDGLAGKVTEVIINPCNRLVTHVVIAANYEIPGRTVGGNFLVPAEAVNNAGEGSLFLIYSLSALMVNPLYQEADFPPAPAEWRPPYPYTPGEVRWSNKIGSVERYQN